MLVRGGGFCCNVMVCNGVGVIVVGRMGVVVCIGGCVCACVRRSLGVWVLCCAGSLQVVGVFCWCCWCGVWPVFIVETSKFGLWVTNGCGVRLEYFLSPLVYLRFLGHVWFSVCRAE